MFMHLCYTARKRTTQHRTWFQYPLSIHRIGNVPFKSEGDWSAWEMQTQTTVSACSRAIDRGDGLPKRAG